jgi:hypothetical protein
MKPQSGTHRIDLKVKCSGFDGFLFLASEFSQTIGEGVGDAEFHILDLAKLLMNKSSGLKVADSQSGLNYSW